MKFAPPGTPAAMPMKGTSFPRVSAVRSVVIDRPMQQTLELVRDIELLEPLERKARAVEVHPDSSTSGWYRIHGRLMRLVPWTGDFSFAQSQNGWHSADLHRRSDGWRISGGFVVTPVDQDSCRVTHYEDYVPPGRLRVDASRPRRVHATVADRRDARPQATRRDSTPSQERAQHALAGSPEA